MSFEVLYGYELDQIDRLQIQLWAGDLGISPKELLKAFMDASDETRTDRCYDEEPNLFSVSNGTIVDLTWDVSRLHKLPRRWIGGAVAAAAHQRRRKAIS